MSAHVLAVGRHGLVVDRLWAHGASTSLICGPEARLSSMDGAQHQAVVLLDDDAGPAFVSAARTLHHAQPLTAVVAFDDHYVPIAAAIADTLGIGGGNALAAVTDTHDKVRMRARLREAGERQPAAAAAAAPQDVLAFGERHGWPVVVKPTFGAGSTGVSVSVGPAQAEEAFARAATRTEDTRTGRVHVEEQLGGRLLTVDTFSVDGVHHPVMIGFELFTKDTPSPLYLCTGIPAPLDAHHRQQVQETMSRTLTLLGVTTGPAHSEVFLSLDDDGTSSVVVVEVQLRLGGDFPDLTHRLTGVDLADLWAQALCGVDVTAQLSDLAARVDALDSAAVFLWGAPAVPGRLRSVEANGPLPPAPEVVLREELPHRVGTIRTLADVPVAVLGEGATIRQAVQRARRTAALLRLRTAVEPVTVAGSPGAERAEPR